MQKSSSLVASCLQNWMGWVSSFAAETVRRVRHHARPPHQWKLQIFIFMGEWRRDQKGGRDAFIVDAYRGISGLHMTCSSCRTQQRVKSNNDQIVM